VFARLIDFVRVMRLKTEVKKSAKMIGCGSYSLVSLFCRVSALLG